MIETTVLGTVVECDQVVADMFDLTPIIQVDHVIQYV
jgi:hypothetical protein